MLQKLKCLAEQFNLAVLLTNQVTADPGAGAALVADAKKPVGGHILAQLLHARDELPAGIAQPERHHLRLPLGEAQPLDREGVLLLSLPLPLFVLRLATRELLRLGALLLARAEQLRAQ